MNVHVYERLGVRPIVNARGMNTMASGSLMPKPVLEAMAEAATAFVDMAELNARAGEHIVRPLRGTSSNTWSISRRRYGGLHARWLHPSGPPPGASV